MSESLVKKNRPWIPDHHLDINETAADVLHMDSAKGVDSKNKRRARQQRKNDNMYNRRIFQRMIYDVRKEMPSSFCDRDSKAFPIYGIVAPAIKVTSNDQQVQALTAELEVKSKAQSVSAHRYKAIPSMPPMRGSVVPKVSPKGAMPKSVLQPPPAAPEATRPALSENPVTIPVKGRPEDPPLHPHGFPKRPPGKR